VLTGARRLYDFRRGIDQASQDMINPIKIYQTAHGLGDQIATLIPGADGQKAAPGALARSLGHGFVEGINPFDKKSAFETGEATANAASVLVPVGGEIGVLNDLRVGLRGANVGRAAAEAGLRAAEVTPEAAAAAARLRAAEEQVAQARAALRGALPRAGAVRGVKRAAQAVTRGAGWARAAAGAAKARRTGGTAGPAPGRAPGERHTEESLRRAQEQFDAQQDAAKEEARANLRRQRRPILAATGARAAHPAPAARPSGSPAADVSHPIVRKTGVMSMAEGAEGAAGRGTGRKPPVEPTGEAEGKPTGTPENHLDTDGALKRRKLKRQNEAADALAYYRYKVENMPQVHPSDHLNPAKEPDYRIEGEIFDCYTPGETRTAKKIRNGISEKVKEGQANRIVLNLSDSNVSAEDIRAALKKEPVMGTEYGPLDQVIGVRPRPPEPDAEPGEIKEGAAVHAPDNMEVFQIFP